MACHSVSRLPCNEASLGPSLTDVCSSSMLLTFLSLLNTLIQKNERITGRCERVRPVEIPDDEYDFVVIGGGAAGCAVAARLSEIREWKVLLLEAGPDEPAGAEIPNFAATFLGTDIIWNYTTNEYYACLSTNGSCAWPSGKNLGGNSAHNLLIYLRGNPTDYNNWAEEGNEGWTWDEVEPFFIKGEDNGEIERVGRKHHGTGGPLSIERFPYTPPFGDAILEAAVEANYEISEDLNGDKITGFSKTQSTNKKGVRRSSARAYLWPIRNRRNLHVSLDSHVVRLIIENHEVIGVDYYKNGELKTVYITKEVVVSGGTVGSPHLLLLSGIGPKDHLDSVGVEVVLDLPGVGENLHDHPATQVQATINDIDTVDDNWAVAMEYLAYQTGPLSATGSTPVLGLLASNATAPDYPDLEIYIASYFPKCGPGGTGVLPNTDKRIVHCLATYLHPKSRGRITLKSKDPYEHPMIRANYLAESNDVDRIVDGIKIILQLADTKAFRAYNFTVPQVPACSGHKFNSDEYWVCVARQANFALYHQAGTCKMGPSSDPMAVVDPRLRVHGIKGLRVADNSIMPQVISGNTQSPAMMIGERAADFIKRDWDRKYDQSTCSFGVSKKLEPKGRMICNYNSSLNCNADPLGPSLAEICQCSMLCVFLSLLNDWVLSNSKISGRCERVKSVKSPAEEYDFIVIGGGGAGSAVAGRLSENPDWKVLVLEAGPDAPAGGEVPGFYKHLIDSKVDWRYKTANEKYACLSGNGSCSIVSGKMLGGSTAINAMKYIKGNPTDYNNWAKKGNVGWTWDEVQRFYQKLEDNRNVDDAGRQFYHSTVRPLRIEKFPYLPRFANSIFAAADEVGYGINEDLNSEHLTGFGVARGTIKNGVRFSSARAFLWPARNRKNLHVSLNSLASRVIIKNEKAVGVEYYQNDVLKTIRVSREVVISAGTMRSPHVLLLSGVGPKEHLKSMGVKMVKDLPGVGYNFHDHIGFLLNFTINEPDEYDNNLAIAHEYMMNQTGPLSSIGLNQVMATMKSKAASPDHPDLQLYFNGYTSRCAPGEIGALRSSGKRTVAIRALNLRPRSRGRISLASNNPHEYPLIWGNSLSDPRDVDGLVEAIELGLKLADAPALRVTHNMTLSTEPIKACSKYIFSSKKYWICAIRQSTMISDGHMAGSCKMGPSYDSMAVVDPRLRVYGIKGLRVADASIMPQVTSGNTQAPSIMIGERAADFIKKDWTRFEYKQEA